MPFILERAPAGRDRTYPITLWQDLKNFNSHAPRGARHDCCMSCAARGTFQLTRPSRGATMTPCISSMRCKFQLTRPSRGATLTAALKSMRTEISTHTPLAGRDSRSHSGAPMLPISTHTPLAGRDMKCSVLTAFILTISTHTPLAGRDPTNCVLRAAPPQEADLCTVSDA